MASSFYDVVLLGTRLSSLVCGAVLAKRGFRVLVLGQEDLPPTYGAAGLELPRAPFRFLAGHTPIVRRTLSELALHQLVRRRMTTVDPPMQVCLPRIRFDLALGAEALDREIEREFAEVKRPVEDLHRAVQRASDGFDRMTERDLMFPPEGFFERREFERAAEGQLFAPRSGESWDPLGELPEDHAFRHVLGVPARFESGLDPSQLGGLGLTRPYALWQKGGGTLEGGYPWLRQQLLDRISTFSGEVRPREHADRILVRHGATVGVRLGASGDEVGCSFVVAACDVASLLRLVPDRSPFEEIFERIGEPQPRWFRYTLNCVVRAEGVPPGMAPDVFFVRDPERARGGENVLHVQTTPPDSAGRRLFCVQTLLPRRGVEEMDGYIEHARERVLAALVDLVPFLDRHLLFVDSPHDGRDVQDMTNRTTIPPDEPWSRGRSTMEAIYGYPVRGALGVCAMPSRMPIRRLFLCNDQVVPGLGTEGSFLAAWTVARLITKADRKKEWMRRGLWTKVEI